MFVSGLKRFKRLILRLFGYYKKYVLHDGRQTRQVIKLPGSGPKILIIGPGEVSLPVSGWGAVEYIVMKHSELLNKLGYEVTILNSWHHRDWIKALRTKPDFVILHYDMFAIRWGLYKRFFSIPTLVFSHFGFAAFPDKWNSTFSNSFNYFSKFEYVGCLSERILNTFRSINPNANLVLIPNGTDVEEYPILVSSRINKYILIGKVEERKRQVEICKSLVNSDLIDFVGPIQDPEFAGLSEVQKKAFLGEWAREKIQLELPKYRGLILMSDAEADALVLHEALSAGIEIFALEEALGSQQICDWVHLVASTKALENLLERKLLSDPISREVIRAFAAKNSWETRVQKISELVLESMAKKAI
jgi:glycosyltransferase involved in cell wall biosynthesis